MFEIGEKEIVNNDKLEIYHNTNNNEYIPLAKIPEFYGPDNGPRLGLPAKTVVEPPKDYLLQIYIGTIGLLGIVILYKYYERS